MRETVALAAARDDLSAVKRLLASGADPNAEEGVTALMNAAATGSIPIMNELLRAGARVNTTDDSGWTALMYAVQFSKHDDPAIVNLLLSAGANVNARATGGQFPAFAGLTGLDIASTRRLSAIEARLREAGARVGHALALQPRGRRIYVACMKCRYQDCVHVSPPNICPKCGGRWSVIADADAVDKYKRRNFEEKVRVATIASIFGMAVLIIFIALTVRGCSA